MKPARLAAAALILAITWGCDAAENEAGQDPVSVVAERPELMPEMLEVSAVGSARAETSATIYPESAGQVVAVRFSAGDFVRAGEPLVELDRRRQQLAVELADVAVQEAAQLLGRYRRIEDTGAISASQIEAGETALASARVELEQAKELLADRTVRAPFSGHIGFTDVDRGDRIGPDIAIGQLDRRSTLYVDFPAPEAAFSRLAPGTSVSVTPFAEPERTIEARVIAVGTAIASDQRTYMVRTAIDNADDSLRPGMSFRVEFADQGAMRPAVPEEAIVWGGEGSYLWVVREGAARRVPLTITSRRSGRALIDAPLRADDLVITQGVQKVREGQAVNLVRRAQPQPQDVRLRAGAPDAGADSGGSGTGEGDGG